MKITLICNAGLMLEHDGNILLVDAPNKRCDPFYVLPDDVWDGIVASGRICGLYFSHDHPDHRDGRKVEQFRNVHPNIPVFLPDENTTEGTVTMGPFRLYYREVPHAPLPRLPKHVVTWIECGGISIYLPADAALDVANHQAFLAGRQADIGIWNPMYLSRPATRTLMHQSAIKNYIYHMPLDKDDKMGIWKKCRLNFQRAEDELRDVTLLERYPSQIL